MKTTNEATNQMNEEAIFKEASDLFIESAKTEADFLNLNEFLVKHTNYIPLMTPNRGSYNMAFEVKEMLKQFTEDWKTFSDTEKLTSESLKLQLDSYKQIEDFIVVVNEVAKSNLEEMVNDSKFTPKDIVHAMFEITDKAHKTIIEKIDFLERLANVYSTMTIIRAFKDIQDTRDLTVNMRKLRGVLLDLKFDENGKPHIKYEVMVKRGTPATRHYVKMRNYKGTLAY